MRLSRLGLLAAWGVCVHAQTPTMVPVPPSSLTFYSYSPVTPPTPPLGAQFLLTFPNQTTGSQLTIPACSTYANLTYDHYNYVTSSNTWTGPVTGPVDAYFTMFDASTNASAGWSGLSFNASFGGILGSNTSPSSQAFVQSIYFSTNNCYEYGPEVGFYRLLENPGNSTEQNTVYFYYALNSNCIYVAPLGSCRDKQTGVSLIPNTVSVPLTIPATNSAGGTNWVYSAYMSSPTSFQVAVADPLTGASITQQTIPIDPSGFFASTAGTMFASGLSGYITATQQRDSPFGGITDSMSNPLKLTVFAMAQIVLGSISPIQAQTYGSGWGWCEKGASVVVAPSTVGGSPVSRNFQQSYPSCTVTVYNAGTTAPATIFSNNTGTPLNNPFNANTIGFWEFFANNGSYDVQLSGGGLAGPVSIPAVNIFNQSGFSPANFFATHEIGVYGQGSTTLTAGFTSPPLTSSIAWQLPSVDAAGCWESNGAGVLSIRSCVPGGPTNAIQTNNGVGGFYGDNNLLWNPTTQIMNIVGKAGTPSILSGVGFIQSGGGFFSSVNSWQGFNTNTDGALLRGVHVAPNSAGNAGGYINLAVLGYANQPAPLPGLASFGPHTALMWVSATNTMAADDTYGLNTNLFINASGGFAVCVNVSSACGPAQYNSMQVPNGGMAALSFTANNYTNTGSHAGVPPLTNGDSFNPGAIYFDTTIGGMQLWNGSAWINIGSGGGGGAPGGPTTAVQINAGSGAFGGSSNLVYTSQQLRSTAASSGSAAFYALTGFIQSDNGYASIACSRYNCFQSVNGSSVLTGGMAAQSFTAANYVQTGNYAGSTGSGPTLTTGDSANAGAMSWSTAGSCEAVYNGSTWVCISSGAAGPTTAVQYNNSGSLAGSANMEWNNTTKLLTVTTVGSTAGVAVANGYMQADTGFIATSGVATLWNAIQAPTGGMGAISFTASKYIQAGNNTSGPPSATSGDSFHAGGLYFDITAACLEVYNGTAWSCLGSGGGTSPGGVNTNVQFNNSSAFGGSPNFTWNNGAQLLTVTATSSSVAGIAVATGYIQSDQGFLATSLTAHNYNAFQANTGGMAAQSFTATGYVQSGANSAIPTLTTGDTYHPGALYYNTTSHCESVFTDTSGWACLSSGSGIVPGGVNTNVQYNGSGTFAGSANFTWNNTSQLLNVIGIASTAGMNVQNGFIQSDGGFVVNSSSQYNSIHTTSTGGMAGVNFTATGYIQTGQYTAALATGPTMTTSDTAHPGAMSWSTVGGCEALYNGSTWTCLATGGVSSLNGLTGALAIQGVTNEVIVTTTSPLIVLSTPQPIATTSNVQFGSVQAGNFVATGTGSTITYQNSNGTFSTDGNGNLSVGGAGSVVAANGSTGGFNVTANVALNSIQSVGGIYSQNGGGNNCGILFRDSLSLLSGCVATHYEVGMGNNGAGGIIRVGTGSGSGGLDGNGATLLLTASSGSIQTTGAHLGNNAVFADGTTASQVNFSSGAVTTDSGGYLSSINANSAFVSGGAAFNTGTSWVAKAGNAAMIGMVGGFGVEFLVGNGLSIGGTFTPSLVASIQSGALNFSGHLNASLNAVSPSLSGGSCVLGSGSTDTRGSIVFNAPGTCNLNFASAYSSTPVCVGAPSNINSSSSVLFFGASTTQWTVNSGNTTTVYYHCMQ